MYYLVRNYEPIKDPNKPTTKKLFDEAQAIRYAHDTAVNAANMDTLRIAPIKADVEGATPKESRHWFLCEEINDKNTWRSCAEMWRDTALFYRKLLVDDGIIKPKQ